VRAAPDKQISLTDPDARSMATSGKDTGLVATMSRPRLKARMERGLRGSGRAGGC
jgi:hypothetical protein